MLSSPACGQFSALQVQAEQEKQQSGEVAAGLLGAVLLVGLAAASHGPGPGPGPRVAPHAPAPVPPPRPPM